MCMPALLDFVTGGSVCVLMYCVCCVLFAKGHYPLTGSTNLRQSFQMCVVTATKLLQ
jgi:hypothetical protein